MAVCCNGYSKVRAYPAVKLSPGLLARDSVVADGGIVNTGITSAAACAGDVYAPLAVDGEGPAKVFESSVVALYPRLLARSSGIADGGVFRVAATEACAGDVDAPFAVDGEGFDMVNASPIIVLGPYLVTRSSVVANSGVVEGGAIAVPSDVDSALIVNGDGYSIAFAVTGLMIALYPGLLARCGIVADGDVVTAAGAGDINAALFVYC